MTTCLFLVHILLHYPTISLSLYKTGRIIIPVTHTPIIIDKIIIINLPIKEISLYLCDMSDHSRLQSVNLLKSKYNSVMKSPLDRAYCIIVT